MQLETAIEPTRCVSRDTDNTSSGFGSQSLLEKLY